MRIIKLITGGSVLIGGLITTFLMFSMAIEKGWGKNAPIDIVYTSVMILFLISCIIYPIINKFWKK